MILAVVLFGTLAACANKVDVGRRADQGSRSTLGTAASTTVTTTKTDFALGEKVVTTDGDSVQVHTFLASTPPSNPYIRPGAGNVFAAIDAEGCAAPTSSGGFLFNAAAFKAQMADNTRRNEAFSEKDPPLHLTTLAAGQCVRGWVSFEVPQGQKPTFIVYESNSSASFRPIVVRWAVQ